MNEAQIKFYTDLMHKAHAELNLATYAKNLERVEFLHNLILGYEAKINSSDMGGEMTPNPPPKKEQDA
jgi:hypothetical protein